MSYPVNQKINPYQQPPMGLGGEQLQNVDSEKIRQGVNNSPVTKATQHDNPALLLGVMAPTMAATAWGMSKFSESCRGEYSQSSLGRIEAYGNRLGKSKVFNNPFVEGIQKNYGKFKNFLNEKIINKNKVLYAMFNTRSQPRNKMVLMMAGGIDSEMANPAAQILDKYVKDGNKLTIKDQATNIVRELTKDELKELVENSHKKENIDKIINICEQQGLEGKYKVTKTFKIPFSKKLFGEEKYLSEMLGSFGQKVLGKEVYFSELANKLNAAKGAGKMAEKTALGKALPRQVLRVLEGLTNANTGGGAIAILMGSYIIADSIVKSIKAPRDEKGKTFAENIIYNLGWYLTMPLGIKAMHSIGGLQYIGMTKEQVEAYRKDLEAFNKKAQEGGFATKKDYIDEAKKLTERLKGDTKLTKGDGLVKNGVKGFKNILHRPLKFIGRLFTAGLESKRAFIPKTPGGVEKFFGTGFFKWLGVNETKAGKITRNLGFTMKNWCFGSPLRFGVFMFAIAPFLGKLAAKCSHLVFGRPTKSVLDEGKEEKKEPTQQAPVTPIMPRTPAELEAQQLAMQPVQSTQRENMVDMYNKTAPTNPSAQRTMISEPEKPVRRYIPSTEGVKVQPQEVQNNDDEKVNNALSKADRVEIAAQRFVH